MTKKLLDRLDFGKMNILLPNDLIRIVFTLSRISDQRGPTFVKEFLIRCIVYNVTK